MQLIRDLALIAKADDNACDAKQALLSDYANQLDVGESFVAQCLMREPELD